MPPSRERSRQTEPQCVCLSLKTSQVLHLCLNEAPPQSGQGGSAGPKRPPQAPPPPCVQGFRAAPWRPARRAQRSHHRVLLEAAMSSATLSSVSSAPSSSLESGPAPIPFPRLPLPPSHSPANTPAQGQLRPSPRACTCTCTTTRNTPPLGGAQRQPVNQVRVPFPGRWAQAGAAGSSPLGGVQEVPTHDSLFPSHPL